MANFDYQNTFFIQNIAMPIISKKYQFEALLAYKNEYVLQDLTATNKN